MPLPRPPCTHASPVKSREGAHNWQSGTGPQNPSCKEFYNFLAFQSLQFVQEETEMDDEGHPPYSFTLYPLA